MYPNHMHVVTVDGTGVNKIGDLKGKRISTGSPGSATEVFAFRVLEAAGLDKDKDVKRERLGVAESVNAMKDKKIEAFFWVGGLPTAAVTDLAATPSTKIKLLEIAPLVEKMNAKYGPLYSATTIPKATYTGMDADNAERRGLEHHGGERQDARATRLRPDQDHDGERARIWRRSTRKP